MARGEALANTAHYIQAQSGWYVLSLMVGDEDVAKEPFVGWRIANEKLGQSSGIMTAPVTLEGCDPDDDRAILSPDGTVSLPSNGWWPTLEAYIEHLKKNKAAA